jgi:hypothetical protein
MGSDQFFSVRSGFSRWFNQVLGLHKNPTDAMFIHVAFENAEWFASERIEISSASRRIDENRKPVIPGFIRRIGVADQ